MKLLLLVELLSNFNDITAKCVSLKIVVPKNAKLFLRLCENSSDTFYLR